MWKILCLFSIVEFTVKERLLSLSGCAIRRIFGIIAKMIDVMEQRCNYEARDVLNELLIVFEKKLREFKKVLSCSHSAVNW